MKSCTAASPWPAALHILLPLLAAFTALMVVGRLISGVHWLSDIIGSILFSAGGTVKSYAQICLQTLAVNEVIQQ